VPGYSFIQRFYWYALVQGEVTQFRTPQIKLPEYLFSLPFEETSLFEGYYSYFPGYGEFEAGGYYGKMKSMEIQTYT